MPASAKYSPQLIALVREHYPTAALDVLASGLGIPLKRLYRIAARLGLSRVVCCNCGRRPRHVLIDGRCYRCRLIHRRRSRPAPPPDPLDFFGAGKPCQPTAHRPGTPEKLAVLAGRVARGEQLFHPQDAPAGATS